MALKMGSKEDTLEVGSLALMIYSNPGNGKTTVVTTANNPLLLNFNKDGLKRSNNICDYLEISNWDDIKDNQKIIDISIQNHDTIIFDTVDAMLDYIMIYVKKANPKSAKNIQKVYGLLGDEAKEFIDKIRFMDKDIIFVAHQEEKNISGSDTTYAQPKIAGNITKNLINNFLDFNIRLEIEGEGDNAIRVLNCERSEYFANKNPLEMEGLKKVTIPHISQQKGLNLSFLADEIARWKTMLHNKLNDQKKAKNIIDEYQKLFDSCKTLDSLNTIVETIKTDVRLNKIMKTQLLQFYNESKKRIDEQKEIIPPPSQDIPTQMPMSTQEEAKAYEEHLANQEQPPSSNEANNE